MALNGTDLYVRMLNTNSGCVNPRNLDQRLGETFSGAIALGLAHHDD